MDGKNLCRLEILSTFNTILNKHVSFDSYKGFFTLATTRHLTLHENTLTIHDDELSTPELITVS